MSTVPQTESDTEIVTGIVQGIVTKPDGKWQIEINIGQQNPRRLWTKDQDVVTTMMGMIGQTLSFQCGKSHWTMNDGTPVTSLWINGYGAANAPVTIPQPAMQQPVQQTPPPMQPVPTQLPAQPVPVMQAPVQAAQSSTEDKIHRQTATKVAAHLLPYLQPDQRNLDNLIRIAERLVAYYEVGPNPVQQHDDGGPGLTPHDDGIPF